MFRLGWASAFLLPAFLAGGTGVLPESAFKWTRSGPASRLEPALSAILEAQDAHVRSHSSYVRALDEIDLPERPAQIQLAVDAGDDGWVAMAWIERLLAKCFVFEGDVRAPPPSLSPREPECLSDRELRR